MAAEIWIQSSSRAVVRKAALLSALGLVLSLGAGVGSSEGAGWKSAPVVPKLDPTTKRNVLATVRVGIRAGNRADTFAKVGDSITSAPGFLQELTCGRWAPAAYRRPLAPTVALFSRRELPVGSWEYCPDSDSFSRISAASLPGRHSGWPLEPGEAGDVDCAPEESPLACEFRLIHPAYAVILLGTNDVRFPWDPTADFAAHISEIVARSQQLGVVPVLSTVPPRLDADLEARVEKLNEVLYELALSRHLPMINLWRAMYPLPNRGLSDDEIHPSVFGCASSCNPNPCAPACSSVNFSPAALQFGFNQRNLLTLKALNRLRLLVRRWKRKRLEVLHASVRRVRAG